METECSRQSTELPVIIVRCKTMITVSLDIDGFQITAEEAVIFEEELSYLKRTNSQQLQDYPYITFMHKNIMRTNTSDSSYKQIHL